MCPPVKIDRDQLRLHLPWMLVALSFTLGLIGWYCISSISSQRWLGGSSRPGLVCGLVAGSIILFEMLLWPRKFLRRWLLIPARQWMVAHIWLGLVSLPLAVFHTGFHWGGTLPTVFMVLFVLTYLSGVFGLIIQQVIPSLSLRWLPSETIYSQISHISEQNIEDIRQILTVSCGPPPGKSGQATLGSAEDAFEQRTAIIVGAVREVGMVKGRTLESHYVVSGNRDRDILWNAYTELEPFLGRGKQSGSKLVVEAAAQRWFAELRKACQPTSQAIVERMEDFYQQRRQFDLQRTLHHWLHVWLPIHVGLSVAVTILLLLHVYTALKYW
jgi:hypothetical protein